MQSSKLSKTQNSSSSSSVATMADLLKSHDNTFISIKKGETVTGTVTKLTSSEILLDIGAKTEAVVMEKEKKLLKQLLAALKLGDKVTATILNPESDWGYPVVSLRRFNDDSLWKKLVHMHEQKEKVNGTIVEATKGGYLVETSDGISGFLPHSHVEFGQNQQDLMNKTVPLVIVELNRDAKKVIFSQKATTADENFQNAKKNIQTGQELTVTITNITNFGVFVSVPYVLENETHMIDGLIHISEISWDKISEATTLFSPHQEVRTVVIGFDENAKRINLSIKRLTEDPFEKAAGQFAVDQKVTGVVTRIMDSGVVLDLTTKEDRHVDAMMRKDKIPPTVTYQEGQNVVVTITQIDPKKRKITVVPVLLEKPIGYR